jgi:hypothetical protein
MAITMGRIPANVSDAEIRARIVELQETTETDGLDPWWSVEALEDVLWARGARIPGYWDAEPDAVG